MTACGAKVFAARLADDGAPWAEAVISLMQARADAGSACRW
jgi:hypothetical protein